MKILISSLLGLLSLETALSQEVIDRFVVPDIGKAAVLLDYEGKLCIDLAGKKQSLLTFHNSLESTKILDINNDGFQDLIFGFAWRAGHLIHRVFLYNTSSKLFDEFTIPDQRLLDFESTNQRKFRIYHFDDGWDEYTFAPSGKVYRCADERLFLHHELNLTFSVNRTYDANGKLTTTYFSDHIEEKEKLYHYVAVNKLELYREPVFGSGSKGYLVADDKILILDTKDNEWLKIAYTNKKGRKTIAWIHAAEMLIDKYQLNYIKKPEDGNVNLGFWYPYYDDGRLFGLGLGVTNNSADIYSYSNKARIYILLEDTVGRRYLYDLYEVPAASLQPKTLKQTYGKDKDGIWHVPSELLDDNNVEWDEERQQYVIYRHIRENEDAYYPRFMPSGIPDGQYKMYTVLYDPYSGHSSLLSNPQDVTLPLPKVPLKIIDDNVDYD